MGLLELMLTSLLTRMWTHPESRPAPPSSPGLPPLMLKNPNMLHPRPTPQRSQEPHENIT